MTGSVTNTVTCCINNENASLTNETQVGINRPMKMLQTDTCCHKSNDMETYLCIAQSVRVRDL